MATTFEGITWASSRACSRSTSAPEGTGSSKNVPRRPRIVPSSSTPVAISSPNRYRTSFTCGPSVDQLDPVGVLLQAALHRGEVRLLDLLRHRAAGAGADRPVVDLADRGHLGGGAGQEGLVGRVDVRPDELPLQDLVPEVVGDLDD